LHQKSQKTMKNEKHWYVVQKTKQKNNTQQHNADEGGQAMGEDIDTTQMMAGKQWVKN